MIPQQIEISTLEELHDNLDVVRRSAIARKLQLSFFSFIREMWSEVVNDPPQWNWHIPYLASELQKLAIRVSRGEKNPFDLLVNIPPGTTKSLIFAVFFPAWCWTQWPWMRFIKTSYSASLSLEHAEMCRDLIRSEKYNLYFPTLRIKRDKDTKSNFRITHKEVETGIWHIGGNMYSTSVGGTVTGFHAHILLVDDPIDPFKAYSEVELANANRFISQVLPTRMVNKEVTPLAMIMQRVMEGDPSDILLEQKKQGMALKHICLPGKLENQDDIDRVSPPYLIKYYKDGYLDPIRLSESALQKLHLKLGQYGYAGQIQQDSTIPGGGMFKVQKIKIRKLESIQWNYHHIRTVRYWDKAGTDDDGAYTVGVKLAQLRNDKFVVLDVVRGQWSSEKREKIMLQTALSDGKSILQITEQEGGSGGKESAENTKRNLMKYGIPVRLDRPVGNKIFRADPFSVRVNLGQVSLIEGEWNADYISELRKFPKSKYMDQVDATSGAYAELFAVNRAGVW